MTRLNRVRPRLAGTSLILASAFALAALLPAASTLHAQDGVGEPFPSVDSSNFETTGYEPPTAHASIVDGRVLLSRDGETVTLEENEPLISGDRVSTDRGRAELLFADSSTLSLDELTTVEVQGPAFVRVLAGRIALNVDRRVPSNAYRVDANGVMVWIRSAGEFRIAATGSSDSDVRVATLRGLAEVETPRDRVLIRAGYETMAAGRSSALVTYAVPVTSWTAFDRWLDSNRASYSSQTASNYLPSELRMYSGVLETSGSWNYEPSYGYVWYPRVDTDWQPYSVGRWSSVGSYGWTWIGAGRWTWPTHHYGRWGYSGSRWYWVPGSRWAPAWVTWASAPGYVAWCPMGYAGGPRFSVGVSFNSWRGWSSAPSRGFSAGAVIVQRDRGPVSRFNERFVVRSAAPVRPSYRGNVNQSPRNSGLPPNTAQPRAGYGVGQAPRGPIESPRATRGPGAIGAVGEAPRQPAGTPQTPSRGTPANRPAPESRSAEQPRQAPGERTSPRYPSRSNPRVDSSPERRPAQEPTERRQGGSVDRPASPAPVIPTPNPYARSRREAPERVESPRPAPNNERNVPEPRSRGEERRAPAREPATTPEPIRPQGPSRPENVERQAPRQRNGTEAPSSGGGRAAPRSEPRGGGSRGR